MSGNRMNDSDTAKVATEAYNYTYEIFRYRSLDDCLKLAKDRGRIDLSTSGDCTVLAIRATRDLDRDHPGRFDFQMFNVEGHRIARCTKTHVIIDSNSKKGSVIKHPKDKWPYDKKTFEWDGKGLARGNGQIEAISPTQGLALSLQQVGSQSKMVTLFRFHKSGNRYTGGFLKWYIRKDSRDPLAERFFTFQPKSRLEEGKEDEQLCRVVWYEGISGTPKENGTPATLKHCEKEFKAFLEKTWSKEQWRDNDGWRNVHDKVWRTMIKAFGYPVFKKG
ncbi:hypothetical protein IL306_007233 [Fusarium sp. DS 682]|nr:hypothetical protein IL306_007233 [Fusarium sp. DS 682]